MPVSVLYSFLRKVMLLLLLLGKLIWCPQSKESGVWSDLIILWMGEILHQWIYSFSHYLQSFIHPRWWLPDFGTINNISNLNQQNCCHHTLLIQTFASIYRTKVGGAHPFLWKSQGLGGRSPSCRGGVCVTRDDEKWRPLLKRRRDMRYVSRQMIYQNSLESKLCTHTPIWLMSIHILHVSQVSCNW